MKKDLFLKKEIQTVTKHNIFENYLDPWAKIISNQQWVKDIYYVDAFAGSGKYVKTGEIGSPVIAANILLKYQKQDCKIHCLCIEKDPNRYKILEDSLKKFERKLDIEKYNGEFLDFIDPVLKKINKAPAFFFIDPEGFSGMDFDKIEDILNLPHKEVLINFQYNAIQRWLKAPKVERTITKLFGTSKYKTADKETDLIQLYAKQIKKIGAFVWYFRNKFPKKNRTYYYLVYATKKIIGFKIMKEVMFREKSKRYFELSLFKEIDFNTFQEQIYKKYKGRKSIEYNEILGFILQETDCLARDLNKVLKNIGVEKIENPERKSNPILNFPNHNSNSLITKELPDYKYEKILQELLSIPRLKIHKKSYKMLNGKRKILVDRVNDGSIIKRFDKTPEPEKPTDVVCPHFLELKWAYGCPFDCSWCYLKGTFRFRPEGIKPAFKPTEKVRLHTEAFLSQVDTPEILNTGEIADSLMKEGKSFSFSKFIIPMFEKQSKHKVLFVTKSVNIKNLLEIPSKNQVIISYSLNASSVARRWEKRAPSVKRRLEAARQLEEAGYEVRVRIDPIVPIDDWQKHYIKLFDEIFSRFKPSRITLGSLRGLQSTINNTNDRSWVNFLKENSNWGKKIDFTTRLKIYQSMLEHLKNNLGYTDVALCKETVAMWKKLKMNWHKIKCNCVW